jgi:hypothetical protein
MKVRVRKEGSLRHADRKKDKMRNQDESNKKVGTRSLKDLDE